MDRERASHGKGKLRKGQAGKGEAGGRGEATGNDLEPSSGDGFQGKSILVGVTPGVTLLSY